MSLRCPYDVLIKVTRFIIQIQYAFRIFHIYRTVPHPTVFFLIRDEN